VGRVQSSHFKGYLGRPAALGQANAILNDTLHGPRRLRRAEHEGNAARAQAVAHGMRFKATGSAGHAMLHQLQRGIRSGPRVESVARDGGKSSGRPPTPMPSTNRRPRLWSSVRRLLGQQSTGFAGGGQQGFGEQYDIGPVAAAGGARGDEILVVGIETGRSCASVEKPSVVSAMRDVDEQHYLAGLVQRWVIEDDIKVGFQVGAGGGPDTARLVRHPDLDVP